MTDEHYTDDAIDARLRSGLHALVAEAPEPPPFPLGVAARRRWHRPLALAAAALLVAAAAVAVVTAVGRDDDAAVLSREERGLAGTEWVLEAATQNGTPLALPGRPARLAFTACALTSPSTKANGVQPCPTGLRAGGTLGCNSFGADIELDGDRMRAHRVWSTAVGCLGPAKRLEAAAGAVLTTGPSATITRTEGGLTLARAGVELRYRRLRTASRGQALLDTRWALEGVDVVDGRALAAPDEAIELAFESCDIGDCFGPVRMGLGGSVCVNVVDDLEISDRTIVVRRALASTMNCPVDGLDQALTLLVQPERLADIDVAGDRLRLLGDDGTVARFRRLPKAEAPPGTGEEFEAAGLNGVEYRLTWTDRGDTTYLRAELVERFLRKQWLGVEADPDDDVVLSSTRAVSLFGQWYVLGIARSTAARVEVEARDLPGTDDGPGSMEVFSRAGSDGLVPFAGFMTGKPGRIVAYDAGGRVLEETTVP